MKSVVDISCFLSGNRLEMNMSDGFMGWVNLAVQTVVITLFHQHIFT